jgi:hypothetical protein
MTRLRALRSLLPQRLHRFEETPIGTSELPHQSSTFLLEQWVDRDAVQNALDTEDGQDEYLLGGLAMAAASRGLTLQPNEVYTFSVPPIIGGQIAIENMEATDFDVALTIAGQLHRQVRDLPPGTRISGFRLDTGT